MCIRDRSLGGSLENRHAHIGFQFFDRFAQVRLRGVEVVRRLGDGAGPFHLQGVAQIQDIQEIRPLPYDIYEMARRTKTTTPAPLFLPKTVCPYVIIIA